MTAIHHHEPVPRAAIAAACGLVLVTLAGVTAARLSGMQPAASPVAERAAAHVAAVKSRDLRFFDEPDQSVRIVDAQTGETAGGVAFGTKSGFIRGVMRGLARDRHMRGIGINPPFRLTLWANGQLSLTDSVSKRTIELSGFGDTNRNAFLALLK
jgi:putative photosynthetic complex assembly protein